MDSLSRNLKILCLGWYNKGNIGDESYKLSFPIVFPNHFWTFTDFPTQKQIETHDIIVLGGGNILDFHFLNLLKDIKKPIYTISTGTTNPNLDFSIFEKVYVRDVVSQKLIPNSILAPDLAFALKPNKENGKLIIKNLFKNNDLYSKIYIFVWNAHLIGKQEEMSREFIIFHDLCFKISKIIDETNASFLFLPFSTQEPWDDRVSNSWLASKCKFFKKNVVVYDKLNVQDTLDVISASDLVISTRLHSSIFACLSKIPFIDIVHHDKNKSFLKTIGKEECLNYWNFDSERFKKIISSPETIDIPEVQIKGMYDPVFGDQKS